MGASDFKKFKAKNKESCKAHFQLMDETRKVFNEKQDAKEARKAEALKVKKEKDDAAAIPDGFVKGVNKKKTFDMDDGDEVKVEGDIDQTIKKVDNKLKSLEKKKKKAEKEKKELDPKKLKKIQKEKERRKRKREAEERAEEEVKPEKSVVDFTEDEEESKKAVLKSKPKKNKKKKFDTEN